MADVDRDGVDHRTGRIRHARLAGAAVVRQRRQLRIGRVFEIRGCPQPARVIAGEVEPGRGEGSDATVDLGRGNLATQGPRVRGADDGAEAREPVSGREAASDRSRVVDHRRVDEAELARGEQPPADSLCRVAGDRRVRDVEVVPGPDPAARVRDGGVAGDLEEITDDVGLARDRAATIVGAVSVDRRVDDRHVALQREDRPAGAVGGVAVDGRVDDRDVAVLVGVERAAVAVGDVPVDMGVDDQDVARRPIAPPEPSTRLALTIESNTSTPPRRAYTPPPSSLARFPVITERTIVARRIEKMPPPAPPPGSGSRASRESRSRPAS